MEYFSIGVVIMKRKTWIGLLFFIIIVSGLLTFKISTKDTQTIHHHETEQTTEAKQNEADAASGKDNTEKEDEDAESKDDEKDSESKVKEIISEVVQGTVGFFSNKDLNIVAVGDSLTQGVGDSRNQGGYVGMIDRTINEDEQQATIQNFGKRGDRTDQLLHRLKDPKVATSVSEADIVLITIGANDIMQVVKENFTHLTYDQFAEDRVDYEKRLRAVFDEIQSLNDEADVYLIGFYNPFAKYFPDIKELGIIVDDWNTVGENMTDEYPNISYIPTKDLFTDDTIELFADDHFHPNDIGYERMARRVLQYITEKDR